MIWQKFIKSSLWCNKIACTPYQASLSQIGTLQDNKYIKANSMILHSRFVHNLQLPSNPLIWLKKFLANEKWFSLAITRISRILNFLFTLYSHFYRLKNKPILRSVRSNKTRKLLKWFSKPMSSLFIWVFLLICWVEDF